jgi:hypothetical protein
MNKNSAYKILDINPNMKNVSQQVLKKKYYLMALKYHPDKNTSPGASERFHEIKSAYDFLCGVDNVYADDADDVEEDVLVGGGGAAQYFILLLKHILKRRETIQIIQKISEGCISRALELFTAMDISHMIYLHDTLKKYQANIQYFFDTNVLSKMEQLIREKTAQSQIITLHPSIDNLLDCLLYKGYGECSDSAFLVPLWHHELTYELKNPNRELIVKCEPDLPDGITIDDYNNIHVYLSLTVDDVFDKEKIDFFIGEKVFSISCGSMSFYSQQTITLYGCGIPRINHKDIFDVSELSDIYVLVQILHAAAAPN